MDKKSLGLGLVLGITSTLALGAAMQTTVTSSGAANGGPRFQLYFNEDKTYMVDGEIGAVWLETPRSDLPSHQVEAFYRQKR